MHSNNLYFEYICEISQKDKTMLLSGLKAGILEKAIPQLQNLSPAPLWLPAKISLGVFQQFHFIDLENLQFKGGKSIL